MNLKDIYAEIESKLAGISGLQVNTVGTTSPNAPAMQLSVPTAIEYDQAYGNALTRVELNLIVVVSKTSAVDTTQLLLEVTSSEGPRSIKAVLESATYTTLDSLRVAEVSDIDGSLVIGGVSYLHANLTIEIYA